MMNAIDNKMLMIGSTTGLILVLASFFAYAFMPNNTFILTFALGVVMLVGGFVPLYLRVRKLDDEEKATDGTILYMDGYIDYPENDATIISLEDEECQH